MRPLVSMEKRNKEKFIVETGQGWVSREKILHLNQALRLSQLSRKIGILEHLLVARLQQAIAAILSVQVQIHAIIDHCEEELVASKTDPAGVSARTKRDMVNN